MQVIQIRAIVCIVIAYLLVQLDFAFGQDAKHNEHEFLERLATFDEHRTFAENRYVCLVESELVRESQGIAQGIYLQSKRLLVAQLGKIRFHAVCRYRDSMSPFRYHWIQVRRDDGQSNRFILCKHDHFKNIDELPLDKRNEMQRRANIPFVDPFIIPISSIEDEQADRANKKLVDEYAAFYSRKRSSGPKSYHFVLQSNSNSNFWISFAFSQDEPRLPLEWTARVTKEEKDSWDSAKVFSVSQTIWGELDGKYFPLEVRQLENRGHLGEVPTIDEASEVSRLYWLDCDKMEEILTSKGIVQYLKTAPPSADLFSDLKQYALDIKKIP